MLTRFVGDVHGQIDCMGHFDKKTIQLGDLNLYGYDTFFRSGPKITNDDGLSRYADIPEMWSPEFPIAFIDGNHDNHPLLDHDAEDVQKITDKIYYIPRGYMSGDVLFIGGATSIDKANRVPGISWYKEEDFTWHQENRIMGIDQYVEVIVSHDAPSDLMKTLMTDVYKKSSGRALSIFLKHFQPKLWVFAHYHEHYDEVFEGCRFIGLDIGEATDIDIPIADDFFTRLKSLG